MSQRTAERAAKKLERQIARVKRKADHEADKRMGRADKAYRKSLRRIHPKRVRFFNPRRLDQD